MPEFTEGHQRFAFDDQRWKVVKYDEHPDYRNKIGRLPGTRAVDFVGLQDGANGVLYWIEAKDFRGYRIQNRQRMSESEIAIEFAEKVRDSIAGVVGAYRTAGGWDVWQPFVRALWRRENHLHVVLWLEEDAIPAPAGRRANRATVQTDEIKRQLRWLTTKVFVVSGTSGRCPDGLVVTDLPGAGQP
jgi:hypothetical protein